MTKSNGKINWTAVSVTIGITAMVLGWVWSIEHRLGISMDVSGRLKNIEEALYPVLVDYRVNKILEDRNHICPDPANIVDIVSPSPPIVDMVVPELYQLDPDEDIRQAAEVWAQEQLIYSH